MRAFTGKGIGRGAAGLLLAAGLFALTACSSSETVAVTSPRASARPAPPMPSGGTTSFQGSVVSVDPTAGEVVVDVHVVWTPVVQPGTGHRRVLVDSGTAWDPSGGDLKLLPTGMEVQVKAVPVADDVWRALQIQLVDLE